MKNIDTTTILLKALDIELRSLLTNDLQNFRSKQASKNANAIAVKKAA